MLLDILLETIGFEEVMPKDLNFTADDSPKRIAPIINSDFKGQEVWVRDISSDIYMRSDYFSSERKKEYQKLSGQFIPFVQGEIIVKDVAGQLHFYNVRYGPKFTNSDSISRENERLILPTVLSCVSNYRKKLLSEEGYYPGADNYLGVNIYLKGGKDIFDYLIPEFPTPSKMKIINREDIIWGEFISLPSLFQEFSRGEGLRAIAVKKANKEYFNVEFYTDLSSAFSRMSNSATAPANLRGALHLKGFKYLDTVITHPVWSREFGSIPPRGSFYDWKRILEEEGESIKQIFAVLPHLPARGSIINNNMPPDTVMDVYCL